MDISYILIIGIVLVLILTYMQLYNKPLYKNNITRTLRPYFKVK